MTALPLIHLPGSDLLSIQLQSLVLVTLAVIVLAYKPYFDVLWQNLCGTKPLLKVGLLLFVLLATLSSLLTHTQPLPQTLLGSYPEYIGLFQWLSLLVLGFFVCNQIKQLKNSLAIPAVVSLIVLLSIISDRSLIVSNFQLSGLLFQATSFAIYACFGLAFLLGDFQSHYTKRPRLTILCFVVLTVGVILAQSRIGLFAYALICAVTVLTKPHVIKTLLLASAAVALLVINFLSPNLLTRYRNEDVANGLQYRRSIYATSIREIVSKHSVIGNGAGAQPVYLNQQKDVPADIAKSLGIGLRFASAHDLLIDIGLMFGLVPGVLAILAIIRALYSSWQAFRQKEASLALAFLVLLFAAVINVPSLTLTPLFILLLIAGLTHYAQHS